MPLGSCLPQLFLGLPSYDPTFNLPEVHGLFFFLPPLNTTLRFWRIFFPPFFFTARSHLNLLCNPKQQIDFLLVLSECFELVIQVAWCFFLVPLHALLKASPPFQLQGFSYSSSFSDWVGFLGASSLCRAVEELPSLCVWGLAAYRLFTTYLWRVSRQPFHRPVKIFPHPCGITVVSDHFCFLSAHSTSLCPVDSVTVRLVLLIIISAFFYHITPLPHWPRLLMPHCSTNLGICSLLMAFVSLEGQELLAPRISEPTTRGTGLWQHKLPFLSTPLICKVLKLFVGFHINVFPSIREVEYHGWNPLGSQLPLTPLCKPGVSHEYCAHSPKQEVELGEVQDRWLGQRCGSPGTGQDWLADS